MMLTSWIFLINSICVLSFSYPRRIVQKSVVIGPIAMSANDHWNLGKVALKFSASSIALTCLSIGIPNADIFLAPSSNMVLIKPAFADVRAQQKRTYFRFAPKFNIGRGYYASDLQSAVEKDDWTTVSKFFEEYVSKYNPNDKNQIDQTDSYINNYLIRPMKVLAGSFAERGSSPKQKALLEQLAAFEAAMTQLEGCTKDLPGEGFFASPIKMPTGQQRTKQGLEALSKGKDALNKYVEIFNDGLMLELNKLNSI